MGAPGSVAFLFDKRAVLAIETGGRSEDALTELALEVGADDVQVEGEVATLLAPPTEYLGLKARLEKAGAKFVSAEIGYVPQTSVAVTDKSAAATVFALIDALEDNDDVQRVTANFELPDEILAEAAAS